MYISLSSILFVAISYIYGYDSNIWLKRNTYGIVDVDGCVGIVLLENDDGYYVRMLTAGGVNNRIVFDEKMNKIEEANMRSLCQLDGDSSLWIDKKQVIVRNYQFSDELKTNYQVKEIISLFMESSETEWFIIGLNILFLLVGIIFSSFVVADTYYNGIIYFQNKTRNIVLDKS